MGRIYGFYWVLVEGISDWMVAEYQSDNAGNSWFLLPGDMEPIDCDELVEIDELRIVRNNNGKA